MIHYIITGKKIVCDEANQPRQFDKKKKAQNFVDGRRWTLSPTIVTDIRGYREKTKVI